MFETRNLSKDEVLLSVEGTLSGETTNEFHRRMEELVAGSYTTISLDLSRTNAINSSALGKLLMFKKKLNEQGRTLQVKGCSESLFKMFQMLKIDTLMTITM